MGDKPRNEEKYGGEGERDEVKKGAREITMKRLWLWRGARKEERNDVAHEMKKIMERGRAKLSSE